LNLDLLDLGQDQHASQLVGELVEKLLEQRARSTELRLRLRAEVCRLGSFSVQLVRDFSPALGAAPRVVRNVSSRPVQKRPGAVRGNVIQLASGDHEDLLRGVLRVFARQAEPA
jgi:hypothetical protein